MYCKNSLIVLLGVLDLVRSNALPQVTSPPQGPDGGSVVLNIGDLSNFHKSKLNDVPTPTGKSLVLYPTDAREIPPGGVHLLCSPDLQTDLLNTITSECLEKRDPKCLDAVIRRCGDINSILAPEAESDSLQPRQLGLLAIGISLVALYGAVMIGSYVHLESNREALANIHIPSPVLSQLASASTASGIVFKTADNDPSPISAMITATSTGSGPLKTLTADGNGHQEGDIELDAPNNDIADEINNILKQSTCQAPQSKRVRQLQKPVDTDIQECLLKIFIELLNAFQEGQPLHDFVTEVMQRIHNFPLPVFDIEEYASAFTQALVIGANTIPKIQLDIRNTALVAAITFIYFLAAAGTQNRLMEGSKIVLAQANFVKWNEDFQPKCPAKGDEEFPKCDLSICQGKDGSCTVSPLKPCPCDSGCETDYRKFPICSKCAGEYQKCTSGDSKNCDCTEDRFGWFVNPIDPPDWLETQYNIWQSTGPNTFGLDTQGKDPECEDNPSQIQYKLFNDGTGNGVSSRFCDAVSRDPKSRLTQIVDAAGNLIPYRKGTLISKRTPPVDPAAVNGYTFYLQWSGGDGSCDSDCKAAFQTITAAPRCGHLGGQRNYMAVSGSLDTGCGTYSYKILRAAGQKPAPGPISCNQAPADFNPSKKGVSKCWKDISDPIIEYFAETFKNILPGDGNVVDSSMNGLEWGYTITWKHDNGFTYMANAMWVPGCYDHHTMCVDHPQGKSGDKTAFPHSPSEGHSISVGDILKDIHSHCRGGNYGLGGYQDYGCLRYTIAPSWIPGVAKKGKEPPHPENYFNLPDPKDICIGAPK